VAVARDEAFNFIYPANLERLNELGARIEYFSPIEDPAPPAEVDLIYLPGGYPEFYAGRLAANESMRRAIADHAGRGGRIVAECGGMLYLCRSLTISETGDPFPMCGVLALDGTMKGARLHLGYREVVYGGSGFRGHEFHYSTIGGEMTPVGRQTTARGEETAAPIYRYRNTIATYTHLYWADGGDPMTLFDQ
jgi:cobyrinic acid a,c-diamide synthase